MIRRVLLAVLIAGGLVAAGPALGASAVGPGVPAAGPVLAKACAPAPEPASPLAGLPGKLFGTPATASDADPFDDTSVKITDVYGYSYRWQNYDNGCIPGSNVGPGLTTSLANFALASGATVNGFVHGLLGLVVTPTFLEPLDNTLTTMTDAVKGAFWSPWLTPVLLLVGAGLLVLASRANLSGFVTTLGWASLVLVATTYVMSYPVASAQAVDGLVQSTVTVSARAVGTSHGGGGPDRDGAQGAIDEMFDTINRDTLYESWLEGTLGSSDSTLARTYGPDLFRASHLTWSEAETVKNDPAAGKAIVDAKKDLWVKTAAAVEREDSAAYQQLTGNTGRWDAAGTVALRVMLMMPFLVVASVFVVFAYVVTRAFVPLAPAIGVVGMLQVTQAWVMAVLRNVGRFLVLGPAFWAGALLNLVLASAVLDADLPFGLQLVICLAIPLILFKILRPGSAVPGMGAMRRIAREGTRFMFTKRAVQDGVSEGNEKIKDERAPRADPERSVGPVATGTPAPRMIASTQVWVDDQGTYRGNEEQTTGTSRQGQHLGDLPVGAGSAANDRLRRRREVAQSRGRVTPNVLEPGVGPSRRDRLSAESTAERDTSSPQATQNQLPAAVGNHPALTAQHEDYQAGEPATGGGLHRADHRSTRVGGGAGTPVVDDLAAPAATNPTIEVMQHQAPLPEGIVEANSRVVEGEQVFEIWQPPGFTASSSSPTDDEEHR